MPTTSASSAPADRTASAADRSAAGAPPAADRVATGDALLVHQVLSGVVRHLPGVAVLVFDAELRYLVVEGDLLDRHGYTAAGTVGRTLREVVPDAAWATLEPTYRATLRGETITTTIETLDGQGVYETTFVPLLDGGRVIGGMAILRDTTPRA